MFHHILVLVHPEKDNSTSIDRALRLSIPNKTEITLLSLVYSRSLSTDYFFDPAGREKAHESYKNQCARKLLPIQHELNSLGVDAHIDVRWSKHKSHDLECIIEQSGVDLVIKTIREHSALERIFLGHNEWQLIRQSKQPVLLANPCVEYPTDPNIIVAIDPVQSYDKPSTLDHHLLMAGEDIGRLVKGKTAVFHCYDPIPPSLLTDVDSVSYQDLSDTIRHRHQQAFADFMQRHPIDHDRQLLEEGDIYELLPKAVQQLKSPLVVMGAVARSRLDQWLIGSTAEQLLEVVGSDIFVLKSPST